MTLAPKHVNVRHEYNDLAIPLAFFSRFRPVTNNQQCSDLSPQTLPVPLSAAPMRGSSFNVASSRLKLRIDPDWFPLVPSCVESLTIYQHLPEFSQTFNLLLTSFFILPTTFTKPSINHTIFFCSKTGVERLGETFYLGIWDGTHLDDVASRSRVSATLYVPG